MVDLTPTTTPNTKILNADDMIGKPPMTVTVTAVKSVGGEQPIAISFEGDGGKPFMPCKSMRRLLVFIWGKDGQGYVGKRMTLFRDPNVMFGGLKVGGVRISHMSDISEPRVVALAVSKGAKKGYEVKPLGNAPSTVGQTIPAEADQELVKAGDTASAQGLEVYKKWFEGLTKEQKASIASKHEGWKAIAVKSDEAEEAAKQGGA